MMLRVTTPFGLETVVQRLADASASPYRLACAAIGIAYHAEHDDPGVVTRAKDEAGYAGLLATLCSMMESDRNRHIWPETADQLSSLLWNSLGGRNSALESEAAASGQLRGVGLAVACLAALARIQLEAIRNEFLEIGDHLAAGDVLVAPDPGMPARASGSPLSNNPENECNSYETRQLRRYRGDPDDIRVVWHKRYAESLVTLLKYDDKTGIHPKIASGTPVDATTPRTPPEEGYVPTKTSQVTRMMDKLLDDAAQHAVRILVLPELSIADMNEVRRLLAAKPNWAALVVPGSMAAPIPDSPTQYWNQAPVWLTGRYVFDYNKIHPMYTAAQPMVDGDEQPGENGSDPWARRHPEHCTPGDTIHVLWSPEWSVTVVICSDLNSPDIQQALMQAKVNLILVPLLTPKLGNFPTTLAHVAAQNQAVIVTSNSVHPSPPSEEMTSAMYTPMNLEPGWHNDPVGELRIHSWQPSSGSH